MNFTGYKIQPPRRAILRGFADIWQRELHVGDLVYIDPYSDKCATTPQWVNTEICDVFALAILGKFRTPSQVKTRAELLFWRCFMARAYSFEGEQKGMTRLCRHDSITEESPTSELCKIAPEALQWPMSLLR